jgi:hypothetical protein
MEPETLIKKPPWYTWRPIAGPSLTDDQLHSAGLSDRDPGNQESFYVNMEARNRAAVAAWHRGQHGR